ncbi:MAG: Ni/Fe-hydrogenase 1 b-type cytochrome subunit [Sphingomonadales bacterium]|nr:Ni/Fe-hydrogenase 1 b-type cytochrome subunit [Sphingomonadales bacterium]PIX65508.1 MAG: Ni/Fe-hydrogenase 1 b-type cytochrome subunit [Sphingomonadales bacterium CG_4_10_14_3_um_filter_58_15]NCO49251.1 Ni/Fe-hydrogenase 1 b-type cytochrome subunit [Sphingomonadales bacterium]NCP01230.1 Ni/Fe-hydrogenase 1 b-type cytochrome subunit [Sphingomonadales bacterium]NCP26654.1 Ni/Fe-hydrogenase 1 b-type cytochrome subunit [Sphingomonadales bacterium]
MTSEASRILVWDGAVRLVHWLMVVLVPLLWWTAEEGHMDWHRSFGLTMFGLVLFRLIWGLIGTWTARFAPMVRRIGSLKAYVGELRSREHGASFGHSPLASLSVFALLLVLATQVTTGLFSVDVDGLESGPLAVLVSFEAGRQFADIHELNFNLLALLIGLHITAIAFYHFVLKEKLVGPMITGRRARAAFSDSPLPENGTRPLAMLGAAVLSLACVLAVLNFG